MSSTQDDPYLGGRIDESDPRTWNLALKIDVYPLIAKTPSVERREATENQKRRLLRPTSHPADSSAQGLLDKVAAIDHWASQRLQLKDTSYSRFRFRLAKVQEFEESGYVEEFKVTDRSPHSLDQCDSFLALSYCWHCGTWEPALFARSDTAGFGNLSENFPIFPPMWAAFLDERKSPEEPIWLDQVCIEQDDPQDRAAAVACMDLVYRAARKVVVVLEDVELLMSDVDALLAYSEEVNAVPLEEREEGIHGWMAWALRSKLRHEVAIACVKIEQARWWRRAWCSHEFRVGVDHVFLVPATKRSSREWLQDYTRYKSGEGEDPTPESCAVLRFDAEFFATIHFVWCKWTLEGNPQPSPPWIVRLVASNPAHEYPNYGLKTHSISHSQFVFRKAMIARNRRIKRTWMGVFGDNLWFEASSMRDKLAITMNVMESGLSYANTTGEVSLEEATWLVNILALADGDTSVLVATGLTRIIHGLAIPERPLDATSWATIPARDLEHRLGSGQRRPLNIEVSPEGLIIDVTRIAESSDFWPKSRSRSFVAKYIQKWYYAERARRIAADQPVSSPLFKVDPNQLFRENVAQALSIAIDAGIYSENSWTIYCAAMMKREVYYVDFEGQGKAMDEVFKLISRFYREEAGEQVFDPPQDIMEAMFSKVEIVMEFASSVVEAVAGNVHEHEFGLVDTKFQIRLCELSDDTEKWIDFVFVPKRHPGKLLLVCPTAILKCDYLSMDAKCFWILGPGIVRWNRWFDKSSHDTSSHFRLLGKTAIVGPTWQLARERARAVSERVTVSGLNSGGKIEDADLF